MNRALFSAATGMSAQQRSLDVIANNLANSGVNGFKGSVASFGDLAAPGGPGLGTMLLGSRHVIFDQGKLVKSGGPFDMAIEGEGFFAVERQGVPYTRDGSFSRDASGALVNAAGWTLRGVRIPSDAMSVNVSESGAVVAKTPRGARTCGSIRLAQFAAPESLEPLSGTLFEPTAASGKRHLVKAGTNGAPKNRIRHAGTVQRVHRGVHDGDSRGATRVRGQYERRSGRSSETRCCASPTTSTVDSVSARGVSTQFAALLVREMLRPLDASFGQVGDVVSGTLAGSMAQRDSAFTQMLAETLERARG